MKTLEKQWKAWIRIPWAWKLPKTPFMALWWMCMLWRSRKHTLNLKKKIYQKVSRFNWVSNFMKTDIDYQSNCIFIDESAFHINLSRSMAWSTKRTRAVVVQPKTKAITTTILRGISSQGIINVNEKVPYQESSKKS